MSASLVRKSLQIVDPDLNLQNSGKKGRKKIKNVVDLMPDNHKVTKKIGRNNQKAQKVTLLSTSHKQTVLEARKRLKPKEVILKENLEKLERIRKVCSIDLSEEITSQLIERAVTKRSVKPKRKVKKKEEKSVFTEEDFKKFEEEYLGLTISCLIILYLFFRLMLIPILPLDDDNPLNLSPPITIMLTCAILGFFFISGLSIYTLYILYKSNANLKAAKAEKFTR